MKQGFKVMDSDLHTMEPDGLWEKYLDEPFKKFAPRFTRGTEAAPNQPVIKVGDLEIGEMSRRPRTAVVGKDLQRRAFARHPAPGADHLVAAVVAVRLDDHATRRLARGGSCARGGSPRAAFRARPGPACGAP